VTFLALLIAGVTWYLALAYGLAAGVVTAVLLVLYLRRTHRTLALQRKRAEAEAAAAEAPTVPGEVSEAEQAPASSRAVGVGAGPEKPPTPGVGGETEEMPAPKAGAPAAGPGGRSSRFAGLRRRRNG
jgi:hypothetical protein